jgi:hypothetical protein
MRSRAVGVEDFVAVVAFTVERSVPAAFIEAAPFMSVAAIVSEVRDQHTLSQVAPVAPDIQSPGAPVVPDTQGATTVGIVDTVLQRW